MKELSSQFASAVRRDVLADAVGTRSNTVGPDTLKKLVAYGNEFLQRERLSPENSSEILWFSISFGKPVEIGLTWALNPKDPWDDRFEAGFFWRLWSETDEEAGSGILTSQQAQEELARYLKRGSE